MALWALRHTTPDIPAGTCYGRLDIPLCARYPEELEQVRRDLGDRPWDRVFCSPLQRCARLAGDLGLQVKLEPSLMEMDFGEWEGRLWEEIPRSQMDRWGENWQTEGPPGGESFEDIKNRLKPFLESLSPEGNTLIITHGGVIRCLLHLVRFIDTRNLFDNPIPYGSLTRF